MSSGNRPPSCKPSHLPVDEKKGIQIEQAQLPKLDNGDLGPGWYWRDWIIAHELMREAKAMIER